MSDFNDKFITIQNDMKAPKGQRNNFGNYNYRSCEDILQAAKPLCNAVGLWINITDEVVQIGDRFYIKATAKITDGSSCATAQGLAREPLIKKGMDESQITVAASSYARKYALNGLLAIDDSKDADNDPPYDPNEKIGSTGVKTIKKLLEDLDNEAFDKFMKWANVEDVSEITVGNYEAIVNALIARKRKEER